MPNVMTTMAQVLCPHGGKGAPALFSDKWMAHGGCVHAEGDTGTIACPFILSPCGGYQLRSMHLNATKIDGRNVILVTDFNQTLTGLPLTIVEVHDTFDNTTPAPLPAVGPAPALDPELLDETKPLVLAAPPQFTVPTVPLPGLPPPLIVTFTLFSTFPLQWMLFVVDEAVRANVDLTNGFPGILLAPSGGEWTTPSLTIVLTFTPPFLALLPPGNKYHFFMTGVSKRGVNHFTEFVLTKT